MESHQRMHSYIMCSEFLIPPYPTIPQAPRFIPDGRISRVRLAILTPRFFSLKGLPNYIET